MTFFFFQFHRVVFNVTLYSTYNTRKSFCCYLFDNNTLDTFMTCVLTIIKRALYLNEFLLVFEKRIKL